MSKIAFVYPGQGAQKIGMGKDFYDTNKEIFDYHCDLLGMNIAQICFEEEELINQTQYTQPALLAVEMAITNEILKLGIKPDITAGLSLGEYGAIYACGAIDFESALNLVTKRGYFMENATQKGEGGMTAVIGLSGKDVEDAIKGVEGVSVANYNTDKQTVITGLLANMDEAESKLKEAGAKIVKRLNVSGPFHSKFLYEAGQKLSNYLEKTSFKNLHIPYISNVTAESVDDVSNIRNLLEKQVYSPVHWYQSILYLIESGVDVFVEIGPSKTLSGMIRKIDRSIKVLNVETMDDVLKLKENLDVR